MDKNKIVILFPCVGRRVGLVQSFRQACEELNLDCVIVGADKTEMTPAYQICDKKYTVESVLHSRYAQQISDIIKHEQVDLLVPTVDLDLMLWAQRQQEMAGLGCTTLISSPKVIEICMDKRNTFTFLKEHGFDTPHTMSIEDVDSTVLNYPIILKPWDGYASKHNKIVHDPEEFEFYSQRIPNCIVQEHVVGEEITSDVLVDFEGKVRCVVPRLRMQTRAGEVSKGKTVRHEETIRQAAAFVEKLQCGPGIITVQSFLTHDERILFFDVNPRFGGGVPLSIKAGANFPLWILQWLIGQDPEISMNNWKDGLIMLRYDAEVWVENQIKGASNNCF